MKITAILPAAGKGTRAAFGKNKVLRDLDGKTVLAKAIEAFSLNPRIDDIIISASENDLDEVCKIAETFKNCRVVCGGDTRTQSVYAALYECEDTDYVLIHDAARPFVTQKVINDCIDTVLQYQSAVCALPATDTSVLCDGGCIRTVPDRNGVFTLQTPQAFSYPQILHAYEQIREDEKFTDDSGVYLRYVAPPHIFEGDRKNIKLTFAEDFKMNTNIRTGIGIDTHAFADHGESITLGGVQIPSDRALLAHSDGDVLAHAIADAILSAAGLDDIGHYFPDTDPQYKGADSLLLLKKAAGFVKEKGYIVGNVSAAIIAEKPKLFPYIAEMRENIAASLGISSQNIGITAGTNEKLGYLGRGEGITVTANVLLRSAD